MAGPRLGRLAVCIAERFMTWIRGVRVVRSSVAISLVRREGGQAGQGPTPIRSEAKATGKPFLGQEKKYNFFEWSRVRHPIQVPGRSSTGLDMLGAVAPRRISSLMLAAGLVACVGGGRGSSVAPIPAGHGRVCVVGTVDRLFVQAFGHEASQREAELTGTRTCVAMLPGRVLLLADIGRPEAINVWVDVGETTTVELGSPPRIEATAAETETLSRIISAGICFARDPNCPTVDDRERIERAARSESLRERQVARLLLWGLDDGRRAPGGRDPALALALANEIWRELDGAPMVGASFPGALLDVAHTLGDEALSELESAALAARGVAEGWSPLVRQQLLLGMLARAGIGADSDGLRTRIRAAIATDPTLAGEPIGLSLLQSLGFDSHAIARAEQVARVVIEPFAGQPCESGSRWLLFVYSSTCPACKPALRKLTAMLERDDPWLHVVAMWTDDQPPPIVDHLRVETAELPPSLEGWFESAHGGMAVPYFFGLTCEPSNTLRLVGLGGLDDATDWNARVVVE